MLPIALVALGVGARWVHNLGETTDAPIDVPSIILSAFGFGGLVFGLSQIGGSAAHGTTSAEVAAEATSRITLIVSLAVGVIALALFIWRQLRLQKDDDALLDLRVFRSTNFSLSIGQMGLLSAAFFGVITVIPLYLQGVLEVSCSPDRDSSGFPARSSWGSPVRFIGRIYDRWGTRVLLVPGTVIASAMMWFFTTFDETTAIWTVALGRRSCRSAWRCRSRRSSPLPSGRCSPSSTRTAPRSSEPCSRWRAPRGSPS